MERICPFLAIESDGRTVVDGYDPDHRCRSDGTLEPLERAQQVGVCLGPSFRSCDRYLAAMKAREPLGAVPSPSADALFSQTRLVLDPDRQVRRLSGRAVTIGPSTRRWAVGGALATIGLVAVASGVAGGLSSFGDQRPSPTATARVLTAPDATSLPSAATTPTPRPSPSPTLPPTPAPTPRPTSTPTPDPQPEARVHVVQPGDTLAAIAARYGTSVAAIQAANGLSGDVITIGQELVIP